ncbi:hypothetical protein [Micromonospora sp. NPDC000668]|uniref:hypothetical protein n=1 Tax=Micromonospora sp. NPDC000668 TaxID=3364219 RepID=UPI0036C9D54E
MIGNLAYDALKAAFGKLRRREASPDLMKPDPDVVLLGRTALDTRYGELDVDEVRVADVDVVCFRASDGVEVLFRAKPRGSRHRSSCRLTSRGRTSKRRFARRKSWSASAAR